jgi:hypothetical protein
MTKAKTLVLILFLVSFPALALADEVNVAGSTQGAFDGGAFGNTVTLLGLTYLNSTFDVTTAGGNASVGDAPAVPNFNNLGSMELSTDPNIYAGHTFELQVTFTVPSGIIGSNVAVFTATLAGRVTANSQGGVFVNFDNTPQVFNFNDGTNTGTFSLAVNDVSNITGEQFPIVTTPEPASLLLTGIGMVALGLGSRRFALKRKS